VTEERRQSTMTVVRPRWTWVTCVGDGLDHVVTDDVMAAGIIAGTGEYSAICRVVVVPHAMTAPPGRCCPRCSARLRHRASHPARPTAGRRRAPLIAAVVRRVFRPARR
jgi:hypothetical protein